MTRTEHLLVILMEECAEVAQRASKALRFGLGEVQPDQAETNAERLALEVDDLGAVAKMLRDAEALRDGDPFARQFKREKVEKFLRYSAECGTLTTAGAATATPEAP